MTANALAPSSTAKLSALNMQYKRVVAFHQEGFQP